MSFELDTSGKVFIPAKVWIDMGRVGRISSGYLEWSDLNPFTQGFIEAAFADLRADYAHVCDDANDTLVKGFSDLAPETLARFMDDCERFKADGYGWADDDAEDGAMLWGTRQAGEWVDVGFPPLTLHLNDAGKVAIREIAERAVAS